MADNFDPYYKWLGIPPNEQPPDHYRLLAIKPFESDPDVIDAAADGRMAHLRNYQTSKHAPLAQRLLNEVAAARIDLLNPKTREAYDAQLRARLAAREAPRPAYQPHYPGAIAPQLTSPQPIVPPMPVHPQVAPPSAPFESFPAKPAPFIVDTSASNRRRGGSTVLFGAVGLIAALAIGVGVLVVLNLQRAKTESAIAQPTTTDDTTTGTTTPNQTSSAASPSATTSSTNTASSSPPATASANSPGSTTAPQTASSNTLTSGPQNSPSSDPGSQSSTPASPTPASSPASSPLPGEIEWKGHSGPVHSVAFSADGHTVVSGGEDRTVRFWSVAENRQIRRFNDLPGPIREVRASRDGQIVAASAPQEHKISIWNVNDPLQGVEITAPERKAGYHVDFSADGRYVILGGPGFTQVFDARRGSKVTEKRRDGYDVALSSDGQYFSYGGYYKQVNIAEVAGGKVKWEFKDPTGHVSALAFADSQPYIAASGKDHVVRIWNIDTGKLVTHFDVPDEAVGVIALSADGRRVVTRNNDKGNTEMIRAFDVTSGKQILERKIQGAGEPDISPDGLRLVVGDVWGVIHVIPLPPLPTEGPQSLAELSSPSETPQTAAPREAITRIAAPPQQAVDARIAALRDTNKLDPKATPEDRLRLVKLLLQQGTQVPDPLEQMAILSLAESLAQETGDARLTLKAIDEIGLRFQIDTLDRKLKALADMAEKARDDGMADSLFANLMPVIDQAVASQRVAETATLLDRANDLALKPQGKRYFNELKSARNEVGRISRLWVAARNAKEKLELNADVPEPNLVWGRWLCLQQGDWAAGLPHLAKGSDMKWKEVAAADLAAAGGPPPARLAVADAWYGLAKRGLESDRPAVLRRAAYWYRQILPEVRDDAAKTRIAARIDEVGEGSVPWEQVDDVGNLPPGKWVSVLGLVDLQRDGVDGNWLQIGEAVGSRDERNEIKFELPVTINGSYEFEFDFTAQKGHLTAYLPVGENGCQLWLGQWQARVSGLGWIDGDDALINPTRTPADFKDGQRCRILVRVEQTDTDAVISVWKDAKPYLQWKGPLDSLDGRRRNAIRNLDQPGLGSSLGPVVYHTARVRLLSGDARLLPNETELVGFGER